MISAAGICPTDAVLEIGPGLGVLSNKLAQLAARLYLVEIDPRLAERLRKHFARNDRVRVILADFLRLDLSAVFPEPRIRVVASLPYKVATSILFRLLEHRRRFPDATVMLQKEMAERLYARPGTKAYGIPTVLMQLYATITVVCTVRPQSFFPAPKITSQIVRLTFSDLPRVVVHSERTFSRVVKAAFAQRRKTLRNALQAVGYQQLATVSERTGIDLRRRGETLSLAEFAALANVLVEHA